MLYRSDRLRLEYSEQVATLWLDVDALSRALLHDLDTAIDVMERCRAAETLVVRSASPGVFLTGPDLDEYSILTDAASRLAFARLSQHTLQRLQGLSSTIATIAYIEGQCIGAGLELALACDFRLAVARPETRLAADFAVCGMLPCGGATQRLPRLIGPRAALDLLIEGQGMPARAAKQIGLVDHAFGPRPAKTELWWFIADVIDRQRRPHPRPWWRRLREHPLLVDPKLFRPLLNQIAADDPIRPLIEALRRGWCLGSAAGYAAERSAFAEFGLHPAAAWRRQLARQRQAQSQAWANVELPRCIGVTALDETGLTLTVDALAAGGCVNVGSGDPEQLRRALRLAVDDGQLNVLEAEQGLKRVALPGRDRFADCAVVFITGPVAGQAAALHELDRRLPAPVVLVFTAPQLPPARLAAQLDWPERVVGLDLAHDELSQSAPELRPTPWTDEQAVARLFRWLEHCGHHPFAPTPSGAQTQPVAA